MRGDRCLVLGLVGLLFPAVAFGWGPDGHRAIGEIAWHLLTPDAEAEVERLLDAVNYDSLAEAGNWADTNARMFSVYDDRKHHHYVDVAPEAEAVDMTRDCPEGCVIQAIWDLRQALEDRSKPKRRRTEAFLFLIHFIEDIHQPLHVVHPDMRGGNDTPVRFFGRQANLHQVWDSRMIDRRLESFADDTKGRAAPWKRWAYELRFGIRPGERAAWSRDLDPVSWAQEVLTPSRGLTFNVRSGEALGEDYYAAAMPMIEYQIQKAGVRLAATLNALFDRSRVSP